MNKSEIEQLRADFFSRDPLLGERALETVLTKYSEKALPIMVPMEEGFGCSSYQIQGRLARLAAAVESPGLDYLIQVIRDGSWHSQSSAAPAFAGLRSRETSAQKGLVAILEKGDVDPQQHAIEALGFLGADGWAFEIAEFAKYGQWTARGLMSPTPSKYYLDTFYRYVVKALVRMTAPLASADRIDRCIRTLMDFLPVCNEVLGRNRVSDWDVRNVQHHFPARAADPLIDRWIKGDSPFLQERGVDALGELRLNRTVDLLLDVLGNQALNDSIRQTAGISISQFASGIAAAQLAKGVDRLKDAPGFSWAFAALYAHDAPWPQCDDIVESISARGGSEQAAHMMYSLALRNDPRAENAFSALNAREGHFRGCNALACARFDSLRARESLHGRDEEAGDPLEHVCILAAQVHAGETQKIDSLHRALATFPDLPLLRPIWKREVLYAFFVAEGENSPRGGLWCEAAVERPDRVLFEMKQLLKSKSNKSRPLPTPGPSSLQPPAAQALPERYDVFISHASEDKSEIAEPLYHGLVAAGASVWFDKAELKLGDRLRRKIDDGLARCRYGVVILSPNFLAKQWPQSELDGLMARETASGDKAILPVWHKLDAKELAKVAPTLADRLACRSSEGIDSIVKQIMAVLEEN